MKCDVVFEKLQGRTPNRFRIAHKEMNDRLDHFFFTLKKMYNQRFVIRKLLGHRPIFLLTLVF